VGVEQDVREVRLVELTGTDRSGEPAVVGLSGELEDPATGIPSAASSLTSG